MAEVSEGRVGPRERMTWLAAELEADGVDLAVVKARLKAQRIETPSWGYADSGTRFKVFAQPGAARTVFEKLDDAAQVHRMTGITPSVALHIPWDQVDDYAEVKAYAASLGLSIGAVNPNLFQEDAYKLGSLTHPDARVRRQAVAHIAHCIEIMRTVGSRVLSLWLADGTNYPGQDDFRARKARLQEGLQAVYGMLDDDMRLLIEYKFFEPAFYHTDIPDWGTSYLLSTRLGPKAQVLVDLGHHPHGTNIPQIVATLIDEGKLGGFHFNSRKYADDDLTTGAVDPYELYLIFVELAAAEADGVAGDVAYMIDQSHNIKPKVEAMIQSVLRIQTAYAKALTLDRATLARRQAEGDVVGAEEIVVRAFSRDLSPLLAEVREEMGVPADPLAAYRRSGYFERIAESRAR